MTDTPIRAKITEAYLMSLDEDKRIEVVNGEMVESQMPAGFMHVIVIDNFYDILKPFVKANKSGIVHTDGLTYVLHVDEKTGIRNSRIPDVAFIRAGRIPKDFDRSRPFPGAPDLAVEVISPSENAEDIARKVASYLRYGTEQVWAAYPMKREVHVYFQIDAPPRVYNASDNLTADSLFPGLTIHVADLFIDES